MTERNMFAICVGHVDSETKNEACDGKHQLVYLSHEALLTIMTRRDLTEYSLPAELGCISGGRGTLC